MSRRRVILALALSVGLACLVVLGRTGTRPSPSSVPISAPASDLAADERRPPADAAQTEASGTEEASTVETNTAHERTEAGARRAALEFVELTEQVVALSPAEAAEVQRSIATSASADQLAQEVFEQLTAIADSVPEGVAVEVAPIGVSSVARGDGWDVSIWYVEVIVYGDELAVEQWRTATYTLQWERDAWRMADLVSVDGPVPSRPASVLASPTQAIASAVASMSDEEVQG